MDKDRTSSHFKEMQGEVYEFAIKLAIIRERGYAGNRDDAHDKMEADYAELKSEYKKTRSGT